MKTARQAGMARMFSERSDALRYIPTETEQGAEQVREYRIRELRREYARDVARYGRVLARSVMHSHGRPCAYRQLERMGEIAWEPPR